jgi:hypothetical protein
VNRREGKRGNEVVDERVGFDGVAERVQEDAGAIPSECGQARGVAGGVGER